MRTNAHFIITAIFAYFVFRNTPLYTLDTVLIMLATTMLIDFDHLINYVVGKRSMNIKRFVKYHFFTYTHKKQLLYPFHTLEFQAVLFLLGFLDIRFFIVFVACISHIVADIVPYMWHHGSILSIRPWLMTWHIRNQWWKRAHIHRSGKPDYLYTL
ncbi:MAG: hypothetical protein ABIA93_02645 [Candidatus Woesearchaeota archaeon]